jgi:DNA-binding transcriptional LysR family regulator
MTFRRGHLRYFVTVAEEGQLTRAAAKLHMAQPALSQAIAQLESELGIQLLQRLPRGVELTPAGGAFLPKARVALAAEMDAAAISRSLARAQEGAMVVGFVGPPPTLTAQDLFMAFANARPKIDVSFQDVPFPCGSTVSWLEEVDVAFCHPPVVEPGVGVQSVRVEPRAVVARKNHPLARKSKLAVAEVLDETFVSYHPDVQPIWAGFHSLDDHRHGPPSVMTVDRTLTSLQMLGVMASCQAITTIPFCDAKLALQVLPDAVAIPLLDADPAVLSLVWRSDHHNPLVEDLVALAREFGERDGHGGPAGA